MNIDDFNLVNLLMEDSTIILYNSRIYLAKTIEDQVKLLYVNGCGGNRKNKLLIGISSIGKSYFIQKISRIIGLTIKEAISIYLNVSETAFQVSIVDCIIEAARLRNIDISDEVKDMPPFDALDKLIWILSTCGYKLIMFIDDAQDLYPTQIDQSIDERKIDILQEIHFMSSMNDCLLFVTGNSVRLSNYAYQRVDYPFSINYPVLNSSRINCLHLYPILDKNEFINCIETFKKLNMLSSDVNEDVSYKHTGGSIGLLMSCGKFAVRAEMITDELLFTVLQILYENTYDKEEVDFFKRRYVESSILEEDLKNTFDKTKSYLDLLDYWCDNGLLLKDEDLSGYTLLSIDILNHVLKKRQHVSALESLGIRYPEARSVAENIWEPLIAEGICEKIFKIPFEKLFEDCIKMIDDKIDLTDLKSNIKSKRKIVCKIQNDRFGIDLLGCSLEKNTLRIDYYQVKLGYPDNFVEMKEVSVLNDRNVKTRFDLLIKSMEKMDFDQEEKIKIEQKFYIITSKKIGDTLLKELLGIEFEVIFLNDLESSYLPHRVISFVQTSQINLFV